jgi:hypothetical protein
MENEITSVLVESKIFMIRGKQVMIDRDLAELYGVETKRITEAVKRNIERFPEEFRFQLTAEEYDFLRSQIATLKENEESTSENLARIKKNRGREFYNAVQNAMRVAVVEANNSSSYNAKYFNCIKWLCI